MKSNLWVLLAAGISLNAGVAARAGTFNGTADNQIDSLGFYYAVGGGLSPNGQTRNGDNATGGTIRFITDDPSWGYTVDLWQKDDWYPSTSSLALTMSNSGSVVFDNNGIETGNVPTNYWDGTSADPAVYGSQVVAYSMSNDYDWIYAGLFVLDHTTTIDQITGYFLVSHDPGSPANGFDPNNSKLQFHSNIFSEVSGELPKNTGSFAGDVFGSDSTPGTFSWSDTGYDRIGGAGSVSDIYRLTYTLNAPITLAAGDYYFSHDASVVPLPSSVWSGLALLGGLSLLGGVQRFRRQRA